VEVLHSRLEFRGGIGSQEGTTSDHSISRNQLEPAIVDSYGVL
jgi:hypothetical protein